jgi:hypothetical protein
MIADLFVTVIGVILGLLAGLWIERRRQAANQRTERADLEDHVSHTLDRVRATLSEIQNYVAGRDTEFFPPVALFDSAALEFAVPRLYATAVPYEKCRRLETLRFRLAAWNHIAVAMNQHFAVKGSHPNEEKVYSILTQRAGYALEAAQKAFNEANSDFAKKA